MALLRIVTFLIHAIVSAMASMLAAVFSRVLPAVLVLVGATALLAVAATSWVGGTVASRRKNKP